jgi:ribose transport system permease protein
MNQMTEKHIKKGPAETRETAWRSGRAFDTVITFAAVIVLFIFFSIVAPNFFTARSILSLGLQTSAVTMMAVGELFTIITGGIDLSIGSVVALAGTVAVMISIAGVPIWLCMVIGVLIGVVAGFLNGLMVTKLKMAPFVATLGMSLVARGVALTITNANPYPAAAGFGALGNNTLFETGPEFPGISYPVIIMILTSLIFAFILGKMRTGRYTYAVGSNEEAARRSGINVNQIKVVAYVISGMMAALVGVILASRMLTAQPNSAIGYELNAIAACVIGGTSLMGGVGTVLGTVIGSFIIGILTVGLTMAGANYFMQQIIIGLVLLGSVTLDQFRNRG